MLSTATGLIAMETTTTSNNTTPITTTTNDDYDQGHQWQSISISSDVCGSNHVGDGGEHGIVDTTKDMMDNIVVEEVRIVCCRWCQDSSNWVATVTVHPHH